MGLSIESSDRYEDAEILGRTVKLKIRMTARETADLLKSLDSFDKYSEKIKSTASETDKERYAKSVSECVSMVVKDQDDDRKFVIDAVLNVDEDSNEFIDMFQFNQIMKYALKTSDENAEADSGKALPGSN